MRPVSFTQKAIGISSLVPIDYFVNPFNVGVAVKTSGGTFTCTVQYTLDDPFTATDAAGTNLTWFTFTGLSAVTAATYASMTTPIRALRTNVAAISGGVLTTTIVQSGPLG